MYFSTDQDVVSMNPFKLAFRTRIVFCIRFDVVSLHDSDSSTNKVYICQLPNTLTRWMGHVTVPITLLSKVSPRWWQCAAGRCATRKAFSSVLGFLVVNCTLWCLFQEDLVPFINHCLAPGTFITALNVNLVFEYPPIYMLACVPTHVDEPRADCDM